MKQHDSKYFACRTPSNPHPPTQGVGSKGENSTFSEHSHVAYQIKGNDECNNIQAYILSLHIPSTHGVGSKVKTCCFFSESIHVTYQLNGNGA